MLVAGTAVSVGTGSAEAELSVLFVVVVSAVSVVVETAVSGSAVGVDGEGASSDWQAANKRNNAITKKKPRGKECFGDFLCIV